MADDVHFGSVRSVQREKGGLDGWMVREWGGGSGNGRGSEHFLHQLDGFRIGDFSDFLLVCPGFFGTDMFFQLEALDVERERFVDGP